MRIVLICAAIIFVFLLAHLSSENVAASGSPSLDSSTPSQCIEGDYYSWPIPVQGGVAPYIYSVKNGDLPPGLNLSSTGVICGIPERAQSRSSYSVIIAVADRSPYIPAEQKYTFTVVFRSNIKIIGNQFAGITKVYVDNKFVDELQDNSTIKKYFPSGVNSTISVDSPIFNPTDNNTRYVFNNRDIIVSGSRPDAEFAFTTEYLLNIVTDPVETANNLPDFYNWLQGAKWYAEDTVLKRTATPEIFVGADTKYTFVQWQLPQYDLQTENALNWKITRSGIVAAKYEKYYMLKENITNVVINGVGWYKAGTWADWRIECYTPRPANDIIGGLLNIQFIPGESYGSIHMDKPRQVEINWEPVVLPVIGSFIMGVLVTIAGTIILRKCKII